MKKTLLYISFTALLSIAQHSFASYTIHAVNNNAGLYMVFNGVDYNSDASSNYCSDYSGKKIACYEVLSPPNQDAGCSVAVGQNKDCSQSITVGDPSSAEIKVGYNLCTQVAYDPQGKPSCPAGSYIARIAVDANHTNNTISFSSDATSQKNKNYFSTQWSGAPSNQLAINSDHFALPQAQNYSNSGTPALVYRGVNLSGFEAGCLTASKDCKYPINSYNYPTLTQEATPMGLAGFNTFRIPVRFEYLNKPGYVAAVAALIKEELAKGYYVVLDMHNYMVTCPSEMAGCQYTDATAGAGTSMLAGLASDWQSLLKDFAAQDAGLLNSDHVMFDLMNEPQGATASDLASSYEATINAIKTLGYDNKILVEGDGWAGLHDFAGSDNAAAFAQLLQKDPGVIINVHQYFDQDFSGTHEECIAMSSDGAEINMPSFLKWVQANRAQVMVTEFGMANNSQCQADARTLLNLIHKHAYTAANGGFVGYTAWYAGHAYNNFNNLGVDGKANGLISSVFTAGDHPYICPTGQAGCVAK